ncbi:hypothetical protein ACVDG8_005380 [Mesorhizobium sp. ORM8.1]
MSDDEVDQTVRIQACTRMIDDARSRAATMLSPISSAAMCGPSDMTMTAPSPISAP